MQERDAADGPEHAEPELIRPEDFLARDRTPDDARRLGIDCWSDDVGLLRVASSLDPTKRSHRIAAWLMLLAVVLPLLLNLWFELT